MALIVTGDFDTPYGTTVSSTYWRWVGLGIDVSRFTANVTMYAYVDEDAYNEGKQPIGQKNFVLNGAEFGAVAVQLETPGNNGLSSIIYANIMSQDSFFEDAVDTEAPPE